jgi:hypothetical protein
LACALIFAGLSARAGAGDRDAGRPRRAGVPARAPLTYQTEHFSIRHGLDGLSVRRIGMLLERLNQQFIATFTPDEQASPVAGKLEWYCFDDRGDYEHYGRQADRADVSWTQAYYSARTNRVALLLTAGVDLCDPPRQAEAQTDDQVLAVSRRAAPPVDQDLDRVVALGQITHEAAHQLAFNRGLQVRGVVYPLWVSEGLATNFEVNFGGEFGLEHENPVRRPRLIEAWKQGRLTDMESFITTVRAPVQHAHVVNDMYAQAWGFFRFLYHHDRPALHKYLAQLNESGPGWRPPATMRRQFTDAFGPIEALRPHWARYLEQLAGDFKAAP